MADAAKYSLGDLWRDLRKRDHYRKQAEQPPQIIRSDLSPAQNAWLNGLYRASDRRFAAKLDREIGAKPGVGSLETFCIVEADGFTAAILQKLCAVAARNTGKTLDDVLSLPIVPGLKLLECYATSKTDSTPPKRGEGNGGPGSTPTQPKRRRRKAKPDAQAKRVERQKQEKADKRLWDAWKGGLGRYRLLEELAREEGKTKLDVQHALDRHRKRLVRTGKWPPGKAAK
jgi:hypothetical protein